MQRRKLWGCDVCRGQRGPWGPSAGRKWGRCPCCAQGCSLGDTGTKDMGTAGMGVMGTAVRAVQAAGAQRTRVRGCIPPLAWGIAAKRDLLLTGREQAGGGHGVARGWKGTGGFGGAAVGQTLPMSQRRTKTMKSAGPSLQPLRKPSSSDRMGLGAGGCSKSTTGARSGQRGREHPSDPLLTPFFASPLSQA